MTVLRRTPWLLIVFVAALCVPWLGSRFYTFLATQITILALFAVSLNLLLGYTGLVSFGHAAYFGIGAYTCAILMKSYGVPFLGAFAAAGVMAASFGLVFGFFCVRLTRIYFAMLTLAFAQIVWAICLKWNDVTGGEQGLPNVPYPELDWLSSLPGFGGLRAGELFYLVALTLAAVCFAVLRRIVQSPFGRMLTVIRDNPERAEFIGVNVRLYELAAFAVAGLFAGLSGALFAIFNRGVFPDFAYWTRSAEVLIMTILGGMGHFWGPVVGSLVLVVLNQHHLLHPVLAVRPRHDPDRAAVRLSGRHTRRAPCRSRPPARLAAVAGRAQAARSQPCLRCTTSRSPSTDLRRSPASASPRSGGRSQLSLDPMALGNRPCSTSSPGICAPMPGACGSRAVTSLGRRRTAFVAWG
jgi:branched-chain amino acid transport system permease protein